MMIKKIGAFSLLYGLILTSTPTLANSTHHAWYGRFDIGWSHMMQDDMRFVLNDGTNVSGQASYTDGKSYQLGMGKQVNSLIREELAFIATTGNNPKIQAQTTVLSSKTDSMALFANTYVDLQHYIKDYLIGYNPYLTAGFGISRNHMDYLDNVSPDTGSAGRVQGNSDYKMAWQVGGGISWELNKKIELDLGFKHYDFGSIHSSTNDTIQAGDLRKPAVFNLHSVQIQLGLRYAF